MKQIVRTYASRRECFVQEAVYDVFPAECFVKTNLLDGRTQILLLEKEPSLLSDDSTNIFKRSNLDCYAGRTNASLCNGNR